MEDALLAQRRTRKRPPRPSHIKPATPPAPRHLMRWDVINELLATTAETRFLEIGVQAGLCGAKIRASRKWGVDPEPKRGAETRYDRFHRGGSDAFFASLPSAERFDVVFVDGLHHWEQVSRDVDNALRHLADGGFVVLHDCCPTSELAQRVPRETGIWNGDCW
ncbi:MAG: class I SAM-dependent methyltransferase, partial [Gammaproteobacteria bacterium]|nr:class I SAM-dependent methyltransferase [Gammaproteobacteria bacterium]